MDANVKAAKERLEMEMDDGLSIAVYEAIRIILSDHARLSALAEPPMPEDVAEAIERWRDESVCPTFRMSRGKRVHLIYMRANDRDIILPHITAQARRLEELEEEIGKLRGMLEWVRHDEGCSAGIDDQKYRCRCGLLEASKAMDG